MRAPLRRTRIHRGRHPLERLWRDLKVTRLGGGSDEMMWELVAAGFRPDHALYEHWITD